jgi:hypothetical protein
MVAGSADNGGCSCISFCSQELMACCQAWRWRQTHKRWGGVLTEDSSGRIVTGETGLAHTRTSKKSVRVHRVHLACHSRVLCCCGSLGARALPMAITPQRQGWGSRKSGFILPIVDDESCDFLYRREKTSQQSSLRRCARSCSGEGDGRVPMAAGFSLPSMVSD